MYKKIIDGLIDQPLLTSLFFIDLVILLLHKPPFLFSLIMMTYLVGMSMYIGQKFNVFKI